MPLGHISFRGKLGGAFKLLPSDVLLPSKAMVAGPDGNCRAGLMCPPAIQEPEEAEISHAGWFVEQLYVSIVSTFPNTFDLVLDSKLHDLNGTNPDYVVFSKIAMVLFLCRNKSPRNDLKLHRDYFWN